MRAAAHCALVAAALAAGSAAPAQAQTPGEPPWTRGTVLSLFGGGNADGEQTAVAGGGGFAWEVSRRFSLEVNVTWLDRGAEANAFAADASVALSLTPGRRVAPFVRVGGGAFRASFDKVESPIPDFYQRRLAGESPFARRAAFSDPMLLGGGGIEAWMGTHISLRPEADLRAVTRGGRAYWLTTFALRFSYHFEERPRPSRSDAGGR